MKIPSFFKVSLIEIHINAYRSFIARDIHVNFPHQALPPPVLDVLRCKQK